MLLSQTRALVHLHSMFKNVLVSSTVPSPSAIPTDNEVYARLLLTKRLGFPIWNPDPDHNLPEECRQTGIRIGDVGIINRDGSWDFLFNICDSPSSTTNQHEGHQLPSTFEMMSINTSKHPQFLKPGFPIASNTMESKSLAGDLSLKGNP
jgi:hypothetical protein